MTEDDQTTAAATAAATATATAPAVTSSRNKSVVHWQEVQDTVSRLASHKGVLAVLILNSDGDIVTQQITPAGAARNAANNNSNNNNNNVNSVLGNPKLLTKMMKVANLYVQSLSGHSNDHQDDDDEAGPETTNGEGTKQQQRPKSSSSVEDISFVRIRTQRDEILVAPKLGYTLVALQDPNVSSL